MSDTLTLDKAGRIVIPKSLRDALHLEFGDSLEIRLSGDEITLRPVRSCVPIRREDGVWVYRSGQPAKSVSIRSLIEDDRSQRILR